jgi:ABC-type phosphate transport system substrate-binding protein
MTESTMLHRLMKRLQPLACAVIVCASLAPMANANADIAVIVNASNPVQSLSAKQVGEYYLGRNRSFEGDAQAIVIDQEQSLPLRGRFFKEVSGFSIGQVTAFWSRLKFTGQMQPLRSIDGDAQVIEFVRSHPHSMGYVERSRLSDLSPAQASKVRQVLLIKE